MPQVCTRCCVPVQRKPRLLARCRGERIAGGSNLFTGSFLVARMPNALSGRKIEEKALTAFFA